MAPELLIAILLVIGGVLVGLAVGRSSGRAAARRCRELEKELAEVQASQTRYRNEVAGHFDKTSDLLRTMTLHYRSVYEHLADGARTLCPERVTGLGAGDDQALLPAGGEPVTEPAQVDPIDARTNGGASAEPSPARSDTGAELAEEPLADPDLPPRTTH
jgi:hypothetical protein